MKTVAELQTEINKLYGEIAVIEQEKLSTNIGMFVEEVRNLLCGVGEGFVEGDYYATTRYYSSIPGVKNIRMVDECNILVKVGSPSGYLLPNNIDIDGKNYSIAFTESKKYREKIDY